MSKAPKKTKLKKLSKKKLRKRLKRILKTETITESIAPPPLTMQALKDALPIKVPPPWMPISESALARSMHKPADHKKALGLIPMAFTLPEPPPGVLPTGSTAIKIAMDSGMAMDNGQPAFSAWAAQQVYAGAFANGVTWMGYTYLSELAQVPEYRRPSEVLATEMTRKWIKLQSVSAKKAPHDENATATSAQRIKELTDAMTDLDVQGAFRKLVETDGFFGRTHLYLDTGDTDNREELVLPIGDGRSEMSKLKFEGKKGFLKAIKVIEPIWTYPAKYNATDPLKPDWYNPQSWFVQGKEMHASRLLTFVMREVPDMLKPAYSFGGLSMSQMAKPYIDNWLRTRQAVSDLVWSFSVRGIKTNMTAAIQGDSDNFFRRIALFANIQTNQSMMTLDKDTEEFFNITTPLSTLNELQAQTQEHQAAVTGIPLVKLLGITPSGLNASSEGEIQTWYEWVKASQEKFFTAKLGCVIDWIMLSLWGEVDPDITFDYEPLRELTEKELADMRKTEMDTDVAGVQAGILDPIESRGRLASDPDSPYADIEVDEVPEPPGGGEDPGQGPDADLAGMLPPRKDGPRREDDGRGGREGDQGRTGAERTSSRGRGDRGKDRSQGRTPEDRKREGEA